MSSIIDKLKIARKLRLSAKNFSQGNVNFKRLFKKVYCVYLKDCVILGKDEFNLKFNGKFINNFLERAFDWIKYYYDSMRVSLLKNLFHPNYNNLTAEEYELIYLGVHKPVHIKVTDAPNETALDLFLEANGFKIANEFLFRISTIYTIKRIE